MTTPGGATSEGDRARALVELLDRRGDEILRSWVDLQGSGIAGRAATEDTATMTARSQAILAAIREGLAASGRIYDPIGREFEALRALIAENSRRGAREGAAPDETAHAILALREALFGVMQDQHVEASTLYDAATTSARLVDSLALLTFDTYVRGREEVILRQTQQLTELSTPVVRLWDGIVGVPLIGTLDSARAQVVMETLLNAIVDERAQVAILDITGVPTVDTLVAQHLLKTVTATRLMGAECIISGIRPSTAQTIVQLGIDLAEIVTRATLADALVTAIARVNAAARATSAGN